MIQLPAPDPAILDAIGCTAEARIAAAPGRLFVLGLCGAQGSGKSTLAAALARRFAARGSAAAILSLDDLYRTKQERERLARAIHPLFRTRGVPGTHDVALGLAAIDALAAGGAAALPRFDKATDDRAAASEPVPAGTQVVILEGWFVGAVPQPGAALAAPVNALERDEDADGRWRLAVNLALGGDYQRLFARIDLLVLLAAPGFEVVARWRTEQEHALRAARGGGMDDAVIPRFVQHYERLTRHVLAELPGRADVVVRLREDRSAGAIERR